MRGFSYAAPVSLRDASRLLGDAENAAIIAGGLSLVPALKQRRMSPDQLVDLARISGLKGIRRVGDRLSIGAMTTHSEISRNSMVRESIGSLAVMAGELGDPAVRARGTLGGSIAWNDPSADYPAALLALDAIIETNKRKVPVDQFYSGAANPALEPGEIITAITLIAPKKTSYAVLRGKSSTLPICGVFVAAFSDAVRVAVTGVSRSGAFRWGDLEQTLMKTTDWSSVPGFQLNADLDCLSNIHASGRYRRHLAGVLAKRAIAQLSD